ncbi:anoctamin-1 isoform X1 [Dermacentor andersoni]|uniref:anoctamin-1 isoform X1 n=1 Tax=Dermacentor andersoni TaxID=34620 RepID=UPI0021558D0B|nr:anoctamin-1-like isoform X1 [Dermacentor andersoni]XP_054934215.1 anoctamin-1-like isoform X1 [Dermacentor andersoni]
MAANIWQDALNAERAASAYERALDEESVLVALGDMKPSPNGDSAALVDESGCVYLSGSRRKVDFVLAYSPAKHQAIRDIFEEELSKAGLVLEHVPQNPSGLCFVKIHAPWEVLSCFAEIMRLKMPVKELPNQNRLGRPVRHPRVRRWGSAKNDRVPGFIGLVGGATQENQSPGCCSEDSSWSLRMQEQNAMLDCEPVEVRSMGRRQKQFAVTFSMSKEYLFDIPEPKEDFFSAAQRAQVVHFILQRKSFSRDTQRRHFGIGRLLADGVYLAAYPLHEGGPDRTSGEGLAAPRTQLRRKWASVLALFCYQPLDDVRRYFGVKIGLYFAWLGFYTTMLLPASLLGLGCFLYGVATLGKHRPVHEMCAGSESRLLMCPLCDNGCEYWRLRDSCTQARLGYLSDNGATVVFSVFMSLWGAAFLELWKRYSARITYQWDLSGFDTLEENSRPEYLARLSHLKKRDVELIEQQEKGGVESLSFWRIRLPFGLLSVSVVLLLVLLAMAAVVGVIVYRMSVRATLALQSEEMSSFIPLITSTTAALLNLLCILLFNMLYTRLAVYLTEMEMPRTQTEYDDSLTLKLYLLQFVNCYSSIFYIAFFKGKFVGRPGKYNTFLNYQQEECGLGGCFVELSIQLAIIMVGKQAFSALSEMALPYAMRLWSHRSFLRSSNNEHQPTQPWERDYLLPDLGSTGLFHEYLEMILQYGFVTLFVAAFPLAPLFALLNNVLEIRLDALKLLSSYRRPVAVRVRDIGIWYRIMDSLGKLAVLTNAVLIAFTSDLVPRLYYRWKVSPTGTLDGFVDFSLSYFDVQDYDEGVRHGNTSGLLGSRYCRYADHRTPPWVENQYKRTSQYFEILVWKFAFVLLFENVIAFLMTIIRWIIPDVPKTIREKIREDNRLTNEIIILQELRRRHVDSLPPVA